jgi:hypothetical protein
VALLIQKMIVEPNEMCNMPYQDEMHQSALPPWETFTEELRSLKTIMKQHLHPPSSPQTFALPMHVASMISPVFHHHMGMPPTLHVHPMVTPHAILKCPQATTHCNQ